MLLHIHDRLRGRRQARHPAQVPGRLRASTQSELPCLACSAVNQLPRHANSVPDCKWYSKPTRYNLANSLPTAIRLHNRYRLDSLPLPHQLGRGSRDALGGYVERLPFFR
jgi:hypothetical protein